jgi:hypothetical protein
VAFIYPSLYSNEQGKGIALASVDASALVTGEARLIESDAILQAVVKRLKLAPDFASTNSPSWASQALDWFRALLLPETRKYSSFDGMVGMLRDKVGVTKDTRSYIISISFTARSADEAAEIVNAIAIEYLRDKAVQRRQEAVTAAESELARQLAINGERHPKVLQAVDALDAARAAVKAVVSPEDDGQDAFVTNETAKLAIPNRTPMAPKGFVILGLSFMLSLLAGTGLALWCDPRGLEPRQFLLGLLLPHLRSGKQFIGGVLDRVGRAPSVRFLLETSRFHRLRIGRASYQKIASPVESGQPDRLGGSDADPTCSSRKRSKLWNTIGRRSPPS